MKIEYTEELVKELITIHDIDFHEELEHILRLEWMKEIQDVLTIAIKENE